jgi:hypothetical protein
LLNNLNVNCCFHIRDLLIFFTKYHECKTKYVTNFDAPDAHFNYSSLLSDAQVEKVGNPKNKNVKTERAVGWKPNRVSWNWAKSVEG